MKTAIGSTVERRSPAALGCATVGICAVAADLYLAGSSDYSIRGLLGLLAFGLLFLLCDQDPVGEMVTFLKKPHCPSFLS